jgi:hypothetical protein
MYADKSEVDLNERLNLARKNSNIAAWSPAKPPRSPLNGLLPSNVLMPVRGDSPSRPVVVEVDDETRAEDTPVASRTIVEDKSEMLRRASKSIDWWARDGADGQSVRDPQYRPPRLLPFESETGRRLLFARTASFRLD